MFVCLLLLSFGSVIKGATLLLLNSFAKVMTLGAFTPKKIFLQSQFEEDTKKIHQGALIMIIPLLTFAGIALKPEKKWPNFHSFNSVSFLAILGSSFNA